MSSFSKRLAVAALVGSLALSLAACGSSDSDGADAPTTEAPGGEATPATDAADPAEVNEPTDDTETEAPADEGTCVEDSDELSGSSTVIWQDGEPVAENTLTFTEEGTLEPSTLTVDVDEPFFVDHGPGTDLRAVKIGCAGAQTLPTGVVAGFVIDAPGTYVIVDEAGNDYAGAEVGSITVE